MYTHSYIYYAYTHVAMHTRVMPLQTQQSKLGSEHYRNTVQAINPQKIS